MRSFTHLFVKSILQNSYFKSRILLHSRLKSIKTYNTSTLDQNIASYNRTKNVKHIYNHWNRKFSVFGISEPTNSICYILAHVFQTENISDVYKKFSIRLNNEEMKKIQQLCELRLKRIPIQYILGEWNFYGLILKMQSPVFIPRPETEELVNIIVKHLENNKKQNILDICCGSGAISLALLKSNPYIKLTALDQSIEACKLTRKNARIHQLDTRLNVLQYQVTNECRLQENEEKFDIIVTNPPYVPSAQVEEVQPEIKLYEDLLALDGGSDGLSIIKPILRLADEKLVDGGKLFMETDTSHPILIKELIQNRSKYGLKYVESYKDFCKKDRFVILQKK